MNFTRILPFENATISFLNAVLLEVLYLEKPDSNFQGIS